MASTAVSTLPKAVIMTTGTCAFCRRISASNSQAVHVGQLEIGQHQVGAVHHLEALFGGGGLVHVEPGGGELQLDYAPQLLFVFDHQNAFLHAVEFVRRADAGCGSIGSSTRKTLPLPGSLSTAILPPCSSTILETMARPSPTPCGLVVKNGLKMDLDLRGVDARRRGRSRRFRPCRPAARVFTRHRAARRRWPARR